MTNSSSPNRINRSHRKWKVAGVLLSALVAVLIYHGGRAALLLRNGREIAARSTTFQRDYFVGKPSGRPLTYLVLGDSTAAGWGANRLEETYPYKIAQAVSQRGFRVHVINVAVGGARLHDVLQTQIADLKAVRPHMVTVSVGANDSTHGTDLIEYSNDLKTLLAALKESGASAILVANTPDMFQTPALIWPLAKKFGGRAQQQNALFSSLLQDLNKSGLPIHAVDLYDKGKLVYAHDKGLYARDLFHPSSKGYGAWAQVFVRVLD